RQSIRLSLHDGRELAFVQIAGLVARRIRRDLHEGQTVRAGERFGLIRFGSRVDVYLPQGAAPLVAVGQRMVGGETVIADLVSRERAFSTASTGASRVYSAVRPSLERSWTRSRTSSASALPRP